MNYDPKNGDITKDGDNLAVYAAETKTVHHSKELPPAVKGQIRKAIEAAGAEVATFQLAPSSEGPVENLEGGGQSSAPRAATQMPPVPKAKNIPPCPPSDPAMGDKTPAVMAWYRKHHPEQYRSRYQNRVTPENSGAHPSAVPSFPDFDDDDDDEQEKSRVIA